MTMSTSGPLSGVRVLDLTSVVVGPYATELLGDMGADVIKVEGPDGDLTRAVGPRREPGMSAQFVTFNRNKRCVGIDLKAQEGRDALLRLVKHSDVFVCNMRPDALRRLQISFDDIAAVNPSIVYCRIVGYGDDHPDRARPAMDDVIQAAAGLVSLQAELTGEPSYVGMPLADMIVGLMAVGAITAALVRSQASGDGEEIELRMYDAVASFVLTPHISGWSFDPPLGEPLYVRSVAPNRKPYRTSDGAMCVSPYTDKQWHRFLSFIGRQELLEDPRFSTVFTRAQHLDELFAEIEPLIAQRSTNEWIAVCEEADVPAARVQSTKQLLEDPVLNANGTINEVEGPDGVLRLLGSPFRFTKAPCQSPQPPRRLGEDTRSVLEAVGYRSDELDSLAERRAIFQAHVSGNEAATR